MNLLIIILLLVCFIANDTAINIPSIRLRSLQSTDKQNSGSNPRAYSTTGSHESTTNSQKATSPETTVSSSQKSTWPLQTPDIPSSKSTLSPHSSSSSPETTASSSHSIKNSKCTWKWDVSYTNVSDGTYIYSRIHNLHHVGNNNNVPLLFVHGFTDSLTYFDYLLEVFDETYNDICDRYSIIEVDVRGHGESQFYNVSTALWTVDRLTLDIIEILQYYHISKAIWVGFSMGGMITINGAINYPSYVDSAVLISAGPYLSSYSRYLLNAAVSQLTCLDHNFKFGTMDPHIFIELGLSQNQALKIETDSYKLSTTAGKSIAESLIMANFSNKQIVQNVLIMSSSVDYIFTPAIIQELITMCIGQVTSYTNFSYGHSFIYYYTNDIISYIWQWLQGANL